MVDAGVAQSIQVSFQNRMAGSVSPFRDRRAGIHDDAAEGKSQAVRMAEEVTLHPSLTAGTVAEPVTPSPSIWQSTRWPVLLP